MKQLKVYILLISVCIFLNAQDSLSVSSDSLKVITRIQKTDSSSLRDSVSDKIQNRVSAKPDSKSPIKQNLLKESVPDDNKRETANAAVEPAANDSAVNNTDSLMQNQDDSLKTTAPDTVSMNKNQGKKAERSISEDTFRIIKEFNIGILIKIVLLLLTGYLLSKLIDKIILVRKKEKRFGRSKAVAGILKTLIWLVAGYMVITIFVNISYDVIPFLIGAVIIFIGVAMIPFAFNLAGGLFVSFTMPFVENDYIVMKDYRGTVKNITLKATYISSEEQGIVLIPNSYFLKNPVANASKSKAEHTLVIDFDFPLEYETKNLLSVIQDAALSNPYTSAKSGIKVFLKETDLVKKTQKIELYVNICDSRFENELRNMLNLNILQTLKKERKI